MGVRLADIPRNTKIYIDANIFLFPAFKHPKFGTVCRDFLVRVEDESVGYVSNFTLNEVFHKLMIADIAKTFNLKPQEVIPHIKKNPTVISKLKILWGEMELIEDSKINMISAGELFPGFVETSKKFNLMATDAMIVETMKRNGLKDIATNDADFKRVKGIKVWKP